MMFPISDNVIKKYMKSTIEKNMIFVQFKQGTSKKEKHYSFVELSDGLRSKIFNVTPSLASQLEAYEMGEECVCSFDVDIMKDSYNIVLVGISAK